MNSGLENMNDMFREGLDGYRVEPNPEVWNGIESKLGLKQLSKINQDSFKNIRINPSSGLWQRIARKLWIYNFQRFTVNQFNVYYLTASLLALVGASMILSSVITNDEKALVAEQIVNINQETANSELTDNPGNQVSYNETRSIQEMNPESSKDPEVGIAAVEDRISAKYTNREAVEEASVAITKIDNSDEPVSKMIESQEVQSVNKQNTNLAEASESKLVNTDYTQPVATEIVSNEPEIPMQELAESDRMNSMPEITSEELDNMDSMDDISDAIAELNTISDVISENIIEGASEGFIDDLSVNSSLPVSEDQSIVEDPFVNKTAPIIVNQESPEEELIGYIERISAKTLLTEPFEKTSEIQFNDDLSIPYPDTIGVDKDENPIVKETTRMSIDVFAASAYTSSVLSSTPEYDSYVKTRESSESSAFNIISAAGVGYNLSFRDVLVRTGVGYADYGESCRFNDKLPISSDQYIYTNGGYFDADTIMITHIDSLLEGSDYQVPYVQQQWIETMDSSLVAVQDTLSLGQQNSRNSYKYIEIPVMVGYQLHHNKFTYSIGGGLITGIFINAAGKTLSEDENNTYAGFRDQSQFTKFNFAAVATLGVNYQLTNRIGIFGEVYYRYGLNSILSSQNYSQKHTMPGLKAGIRINLDKSGNYNVIKDSDY